MTNQFICAKQRSYIFCLCYITAILDLEYSISHLYFTGPLRLVTGHLDLGSGNELFIILLRACHIIKEVSAILILGINSCLIIPPGLLCLHIGFNYHFTVKRCCHVLFIGHNTF